MNKTIRTYNLLTGKVYDETLTEYSKTLLPIIELMLYWSKSHRQLIAGY